jgi:hypothetical protein
MSAPWARDGEPGLACALALVGREALRANRDGRAHITTSRVIVSWNHIEIGIGGEASITAGAMPAVLGQIDSILKNVKQNDFNNEVTLGQAAASKSTIFWMALSAR